MIATIAPAIDQLDMKARVSAILNRHPAVGLAVGVVRNGRLEFFDARGVADIRSQAPITEHTVFRIASITKTFTAIAVMQLWERGLVDLDGPVNDHLRAYELIPANPRFRAATVRDLLTHTAGIPQVPHPWRVAMTNFRTAQAFLELAEPFESGQPLPTLAHYYQGGLRLAAEPGTRFTYGDHGFATLGQIVEDLSGKPLHRYFREHIFEPLGMTDSDLVLSERLKSRLATGYSLGPHGARPVANLEWVTAGASSLYSTPRDMGRYLAALLGGGANEHGSVLKPATLKTMYEPNYQTDARVPGIGLAFFRTFLGEHLAVEHQGLLPGFSSQIFVAPDDGVGVMAFSNGASGAVIWLPVEASGLLRVLLGAPDDVIRTDVPHHPEVWDGICGWYPLSARLTDSQARAFVGLGAEVFVRGGRLWLRGVSPLPALYHGFPLHPDDEKDPYAFRIDLSQFGLGTAKVVFSDPGQATTRVHLDVIPLSLQKRPSIENPRLWITGALGALAFAAAAVAVRRRG